MNYIESPSIQTLAKIVGRGGAGGGRQREKLGYDRKKERERAKTKEGVGDVRGGRGGLEL